MKTEQEILKIRKAVRALAAYVEGIAYRVSSQEEKNMGIAILKEINEILGES